MNKVLNQTLKAIIQAWSLTAFCSFCLSRVQQAYQEAQEQEEIQALLENKGPQVIYKLSAADKMWSITKEK